MKRIVMTIILTITMILAVFVSSCQRGYSGASESITLGTIAWEPSALIYVAENQNYFKANGLNITVNTYDTGLATTDAMLNGEIDISACAEYIIVERAFRKQIIYNLATIAKSENELIIGRIDRGIKTEFDL
jgi:ABC-type nitrate/sulfonate/bicarbonate transport system substrate-binding protein